MGKIKQLQQEKKAVEEKKAELERLIQEAETERTNMIAESEKHIDEFAKGKGLFCGVILDHQNLVAVLDLALRTSEPVKIPARCYLEIND
jgi:hypothetical protein